MRARSQFDVRRREGTGVRTDDGEGRAGLEDTHDGNDEVDSPRRVDGNDVLALNTSIDEVVREDVRRLVDLAVRERPQPVLARNLRRRKTLDDARPVREVLRVRGEDVRDGAAVAAPLEVLLRVREELALLDREERDGPDGVEGAGGSVVDEVEELVEGEGDAGLGEDERVVRYGEGDGREEGGAEGGEARRSGVCRRGRGARGDVDGEVRGERGRLDEGALGLVRLVEEADAEERRRRGSSGFGVFSPPEGLEKGLVGDLVLLGLPLDPLDALDEGPERVGRVELDAQEEWVRRRGGRGGDDEVGVSRIAVEEDDKGREEEVERGRALGVSPRGGSCGAREGRVDALSSRLVVVTPVRVFLLVEERETNERSRDALVDGALLLRFDEGLGRGARVVGGEGESGEVGKALKPPRDLRRRSGHARLQVRGLRELRLPGGEVCERRSRYKQVVLGRQLGERELVWATSNASTVPVSLPQAVPHHCSRERGCTSSPIRKSARCPVSHNLLRFIPTSFNRDPREPRASSSVAPPSGAPTATSRSGCPQPIPPAPSHRGPTHPSSPCSLSCYSGLRVHSRGCIWTPRIHQFSISSSRPPSGGPRPKEPRRWSPMMASPSYPLACVDSRPRTRPSRPPSPRSAFPPQPFARLDSKPGSQQQR